MKGTKISYEEVTNYFFSENHTLLTTKEDFISTVQPLKIKCNLCGNCEEVIFRSFKKRAKCKCKKCYEKAKLKEIEEMIKPKGYSLLSTEFITTKYKLTIRCDKGHIWNPSYDSVIKGCQCLKCRDIEVAKKQKITQEELELRFNIDGYKLLSSYDEYENNETKLKVCCPKGHFYYVSLSNWTNGKRCPRCKESKGESYISNYLKDRAIKFETQKRFTDCVYRKELPFDFYIKDLNIAIEYDGEQHFNKTCFGMSDEEFTELKMRDEIKTQYCKNNNIKLIRIPYFEFDNIDNILNELLE